MHDRTNLRTRLGDLDPGFNHAFFILVKRVTPILEGIERLFPEFTRHDPSHAEKLENITLRILRPDTIALLTDADLFVLLCTLWIHDAGMGGSDEVRRFVQSSASYQKMQQQYARSGISAEDCFRDYVRMHHHEFCPLLAKSLLDDLVNPFIVSWVGRIAKSHGESNLEDHRAWPPSVAVGNDKVLHPPLLAVILRLADILHLSADRAPEYMLEHRKVQNTTSLRHWRAHQISADPHISAGICFFDGEADDDEAYWFVAEFISAMDEELTYCLTSVLPFLDEPLRNPLSFSRVENRIITNGFVAEKQPIRLEIDRTKFLEDLLNDSLYSSQPIWLRELIQNAFDACRDRSAVSADPDIGVVIDVNTQEGVVAISDSGIGMTRNVVERYLFVAGASYWSTMEHRGNVQTQVGHVGRFGIGFMAVLGAATKVIVETRHIGEAHGWRFTIRHPRHVIRVEILDDIPIGTAITLRLRREHQAEIDFEKLFDDTCPFPEFPIQLRVDDALSRQSPAQVPSLRTDPVQLVALEEDPEDVIVHQADIVAPGILGTFAFPMVTIASLRARIPLIGMSLRGTGVAMTSDSRLHFGGISYPMLHALDGTVGYSHLPSLGYINIAVSPNEYALEMNLARDRFIKGQHTTRLLQALSTILDIEISKMLDNELTKLTNPLERSSLIGEYSRAMLDLWLGWIPSLSYVTVAEWIPSGEIGPVIWPGLEVRARNELRFGFLQGDGKIVYKTIQELQEGRNTVYAGGHNSGQISADMMSTLEGEGPQALLLLVLPSVDFGILKLRHWACEERLVPVTSHARSLYGLRFGENSKPYPVYPRELDHLGIAVASGPPNFALLDYRDLMAEAEARPTGTPAITGVLNRNHEQIRLLISWLATMPDTATARRRLGKRFKQLKTALLIGRDTRYEHGTITRIRNILNDLSQYAASTDGVQIREFTTDDFPSYIDGGAVVPFGRFALNPVAIAIADQISRYESHVHTYNLS